MVVCKFWQQGNCKFGAQCRFEHPGGPNTQTSRNGPHQSRGPSGNQNHPNTHNRFDAFQQTTSNRGGGGFGRGGGNGPRDNYQQQQTSNSLQNRISGFGRGRGGFAGGRNQSQNDRRSANARLDQIEVILPGERGGRSGRGRGRGGRNYNESPRTLKVEKSTIINDLTNELPLWLMSSYIPSPQWPKQLFEGYDTEQSPEEIRVLFELAKAQNSAQEYIQLEQHLAAEAESRRARALNDMDGVMQYLQDGANEHPNRIDIVQTSESRGQAAGVFGMPDDHPLNVAKYGPPRNQRGGRNQQQSNSNNNTFGSNQIQTDKQSDPFGGQIPSVVRGPSVTDFGGGGFVSDTQTNMWGGSGFSAPGNQHTPAFGMTTAQQGFGAANFGQPAQSLAINSQPQFGQPQGPSGFGSQGFPQTPASAAFGTSSQQATQFGQPQQPSTGMFGQTAQVSMNDAPMSSGLSQSHNPVNGFGSQSQNGALLASSSQQSNSISLQGQMASAHPPNVSGDIHTYTTSLPNGHLSTWKGRPVQYNQQGIALYQRIDGEWERIWFPAGPAHNGGAILAPQSTTKSLEQAYNFLREHDSFEDGVMPIEPPSANMIRWDI